MIWAMITKMINVLHLGNWLYDLGNDLNARNDLGNDQNDDQCVAFGQLAEWFGQ